MKKLAVLLAAAGMALSAAMLRADNAAAATEIAWQTYKDGLSAADSEDKKVFLYFRSANCTYCREMETKTFTDEAVVGYLNKYFVPVKIDVMAQQKVAMQYGVSAVPNSYFLTEDATVISGLPGFIPADLMINVLRYLHTDSYERMAFVDFLKANE